MTVRQILTISRPRFWLYEAGTFAVGVTAAIMSGASWSPWLVVWFGYFLIPANILIYGINDVFDYETDRRNPKKEGYEGLLRPELHRTVLIIIALVTLPFLGLLTIVPTSAILPFLLFIVCAVQYSAQPIRAKARPVLDSLFSAGHYIATGWFGYAVAGGTGDVAIPLLAGMAWATAMHAYSAVPDIAADTASGIRTIATAFGARRTIMLCAVLYSIAAILASYTLGIITLIFGIPYLLLMERSLRVAGNAEKLMYQYRHFPYLNAVIGAGLWWAIVLLK